MSILFAICIIFLFIVGIRMVFTRYDVHDASSKGSLAFVSRTPT